MDEKVRKLLDNQDWETIVKKLTLYANTRFRFWNLLKQKAIKGYTPEDVALEAISLVYSGVWKWDPSKSDLVTYLKFHVVNGLVSNLARNKEIRTTFAIEELELELDFDIEETLNAKFAIEMISNTLIEEIEIQIFDALLQGMKRSEIIENFRLSPNEYDNALKRLKTKILKFKKLTILK